MDYKTNVNARSVSESPLSLSRRERDRQQRRRDIFAAAERVFAEKSFYGASIEAIARQAEYGTGTVYLYFKDKESLYVELMTEKVGQLYEHVRERIGPEKDPVKALQRLIEARMEFFDGNRSFFQIYMREGMDWWWLKSDKWAGVRQMYEEYVELVEDIIRKGQRRGVLRKGDSRTYAVALTGMMIQLTRDWLEHAPKRPLTYSADFVTQLFLKGAKGKP
jgi:AcrR family transcriptional regulator